MQKPLPLQFRVLRAVYRFQIEGVPGSVAKLKGPFTNEQIRHQGTDAFEPPPQLLPPRGFVTAVGVSRYLLGNYLHPEPTGDIAKEIRELVVLGFVKINSHRRDAQMLLPPLWVQREDGILILHWQSVEQNCLLTCVTEPKGLWAGILEHGLLQTAEHIAITAEGTKAYHELRSMLDANGPKEPKSKTRAFSTDGADNGLKPSHQKAKALYEWAMEEIEGAQDMPLSQLFEKLTNDPRCAGEGLPDNAETFARYCRAAGIQRNTPRQKKGATRSIRRSSEL